MLRLQMEEIGCVLCESDGIADPVVIQDNGWNGRQCQSCSLIYISPRPSADQILQLYSHDSAQTDSAVLLSDQAYRRLHARHSLGILRRYAECGKLLEIGAGAGFFLNEARDGGFVPLGIEPNPRQAAFIRSRGIECDERPLSRAFPGQIFDAIYHCDVTSHFHDLIGEFRLMKQRLRPGGFMMFETGNFADVARQHYDLIPSFQYPDHLFFLGPRSLDILLRRAGFRRVAQHRYSTLAQLALAKRRRPAKTAGREGALIPIDDSAKKRAKAMLRFSLTYKLGRFLPLHSMPETIITVAT
jgi:SAM-dependent methyltransferase